MVATAANPNGLIGGSGRIGQKHQIAELMDSLAPHYGDDFWFLSYHAMALSEDGQLAAARPKIERSVALTRTTRMARTASPMSATRAASRTTARTFLSSWLATYPRDGFFHGHLSWHLSLFELQAGNWTEALQLYRDAIALDRHSGGPQQKMSDGAAFLWRSELAGHPRDAAAWRALYDYANSALPRPGTGLADLHVILAQAVMGDDAALDARARQMEELARDGRYPSGSYLPALSRGFAAFERGDFSARDRRARAARGAKRTHRRQPRAARPDRVHAVEGLSQRRSAGGSADLLDVRRPGASGVPVMGVAAVH